MQHNYVMVLQPSFEGPVVRSWEELSGDDTADAAMFFAMSVSARVNHGLGPLKVQSDDEWTPELMMAYLRTLTPKEFFSFVDDAEVKPKRLNDFARAKIG